MTQKQPQKASLAEDTHLNERASRPRSARTVDSLRPGDAIEIEVAPQPNMEELEGAPSSELMDEGRSSNSYGTQAKSQRQTGVRGQPTSPPMPVAERNRPIDAEDAGRQWLADATEQDNYESAMQNEDDMNRGARVGRATSDASQRMSGQADSEVPEREALREAQTERSAEQRASKRRNPRGSESMHQTSLFDRQ